jgi:putative membrane protein
MRATRSVAPIIGALLAAAALGACKGNQQQVSNGSDTTAAATARVDSAGNPVNPSAAPATATGTDSAANANGNKWSTPAVLAFTTAANAGEIQMGKLGEKKATSAAVKSFARLMVTDHTAMQAEGKKLSAKLNAMPDTTAGDAHDLSSHAADEMKELTDKAAGADWDKNYMDKMVSDHQDVLGKLQDASKNTTDANVRTALEKAVGKVQEHLTKAQDIRGKLK